MTTLPRLVAGDRRRSLVLLVMLGLAQATATVLSAALVHAFFSALEAPAMRAEAVGQLVLVAGLVVAGGTLAGLRALERVLAERFGQGYANEIRLALFDSLSAQSPRTSARRSRGGTLLRFIGDVKSIRRWASLGLPRLLVGATAGTLALAALAMIDGGLAVAATTGFAAAAALLAALTVRVEPALREARRRQALLAADINDRVGTIAVVQVFDQVRRERRRLFRQSGALAEAMVVQAGKLAQLLAVAEFGTVLAAGLLLLAGAARRAGGTLTLADLAAALTIVGLISPAFKDLGRVLGYWRSARVSLDKVQQFLRTPRLADAGTIPAHHDGDAPMLATAQAAIEFAGVTVGLALREFSARAEAGRHIAIVGPNGAGKSTLLALVARLAEPDGGEVRVGDRPVGDYALSALRRGIGAITPDLPLMRGSIARNLCYRWPRAPAAEIEAICHRCGVDDILRTQRRGDRTRVADGGGNLSYGERQRIAWARALLGDPGVLLLDEADANLDPQSAARLARIVDEFPGTVLMVTHQLSRVLAADEVWYVEAGRLLEQGDPHELLGRASRTRRLFRRRLQEVG